MVAYSFKAQFAEPIDLGTKGGTIRNPRKRHAHAGEELQLYTGMRTRQCKLIARKTCISVGQVVLNFNTRLVHIYDVGQWESKRDLDAFAIFDGFRSWEDMRLFWSLTHNTDRFVGVHIRWLPWPKELVP